MSTHFHNAQAPKKSVNLSINSDILRQAKEYNLNLSKTLEERLLEIILEGKRCRWRKENRAAIAAYNRRIDAGGVFSDGLRRF